MTEYPVASKSHYLSVFSQRDDGKQISLDGVRVLNATSLSVLLDKLGWEI